MIPRHSLPFGTGTTVAALVGTEQAVQVSDVEKAYADALGVCAVVLLQSVRAGIHMVVKAVNKPGMIVVGPAYTCHTVHDALALSGARTRLVDSAPGAFLMSPDSIYAATEPGCALVLSEVYGIPYDRDSLQHASRKGPGVRILDMAMSIPVPERMHRLEARDIALFSFGWGKPMYAGWGGIACFQDLELAGCVREIRDRWTTPESFTYRLRRDISTLCQVAMNQRFLYGLSHERHLYRLYKKHTSSQYWQEPPPTARGDTSNAGSDLSERTLPNEWTCPMTALNRKLALHNLRYAVEYADLRRQQAEIYSRTLVESGIVRGSGSKVLPQSHFPIRLPSAARDKLGDYLRGRGIDTSTLFPLSAGLSREHYPHAAEAADEVLALPLGPSITMDEVRMVSRCVLDGLRVLGL